MSKISFASSVELSKRLRSACKSVIPDELARYEMETAVLQILGDLTKPTTPNRTDPISHRIVYLDPADAAYGDDPDRRHFCK